MNWSRFFNRLWCVFAFVWTVMTLSPFFFADMYPLPEGFVEERLAFLAIGLLPTAFLLLAIGWVIDGLKKPYE